MSFIFLEYLADKRVVSSGECQLLINLNKCELAAKSNECEIFYRAYKKPFFSSSSLFASLLRFAYLKSGEYFGGFVVKAFSPQEQVSFIVKFLHLLQKNMCFILFPVF